LLSGQSVSYQQKDVVDGELFRTLRSNDQDLSTLSLNGHATDGVLTKSFVCSGKKTFCQKIP